QAEALGVRERGEREWRLWSNSEARRELEVGRWRRQAELAVFAPLGVRGWVDGVIDLVLFDPDRSEVWVVDWKTNRRRVGEEEEAMLARLAAEYTGQLQ